jgi:SAM-dependent methyltransferase
LKKEQTNYFQFKDFLFTELETCLKDNKIRVLNIGCGVPRIIYDIIHDYATSENKHLLEKIDILNTDIYDTEYDVMKHQTEIFGVIYSLKEIPLSYIPKDFVKLIKVYMQKILEYDPNNHLEKFNGDSSQIVEFTNSFEYSFRNYTNYKKVNLKNLNEYEKLVNEESEKFSIIICEFILHFKEIKRNLNEILNMFSKILKPGGIILIKVHHIDYISKSNPENYSNFSEGEFLGLFSDLKDFQFFDNTFQKNKKWLSNIWQLNS